MQPKMCANIIFKKKTKGLQKKNFLTLENQGEKDKYYQIKLS